MDLLGGLGFPGLVLLGDIEMMIPTGIDCGGKGAWVSV